MTKNVLISIVTGSFNEEGNVDEWFERVLTATKSVENADFEYIWIDNASTDSTVAKVLLWCKKDKRIKLIVNARNFGPVRSPFYAMSLSKGDAVVYMASDLQDVPELLPEFVKLWRGGSEVVAGVYKRSPDGWIMRQCRKLYYSTMTAVSDSEPIIKGFTGFGLFSRKTMNLFKQCGGPSPLTRAMIAEFGLSTAQVIYDKPPRTFGFTKYSFLMLVDQAILSLTTMSKAPIRVATIMGLLLSGLGFMAAIGYLIAKLIFWQSFPVGQAPLLMGIFIFASVQLLFLGLIGEYVSAIHQRLQNKPLVVEKIRVNFEEGDVENIEVTHDEKV